MNTYTINAKGLKEIKKPLRKYHKLGKNGILYSKIK